MPVPLGPLHRENVRSRAQPANLRGAHLQELSTSLPAECRNDHAQLGWVLESQEVDPTNRLHLGPSQGVSLPLDHSEQS